MKRIFFTLCVVLGLVFIALLYTSSSHYRFRQAERYQADLPMTFDHQTHAEQRCVGCHHNFIDNSGQGLCIQCHVNDAELNTQFERQFHRFCRGCHEEKQLLGEKHGPIRICSECHTTDTLP